MYCLSVFNLTEFYGHKTFLSWFKSFLFVCQCRFVLFLFSFFFAKFNFDKLCLIIVRGVFIQHIPQHCVISLIVPPCVIEGFCYSSVSCSTACLLSLLQPLAYRATMFPSRSLGPKYQPKKGPFKLGQLARFSWLFLIFLHSHKPKMMIYVLPQFTCTCEVLACSLLFSLFLHLWFFTLTPEYPKNSRKKRNIYFCCQKKNLI